MLHNYYFILYPLLKFEMASLPSVFKAPTLVSDPAHFTFLGMPLLKATPFHIPLDSVPSHLLKDILLVIYLLTHLFCSLYWVVDLMKLQICSNSSQHTPHIVTCLLSLFQFKVKFFKRIIYIHISNSSPSIPLTFFKIMKKFKYTHSRL